MNLLHNEIVSPRRRDRAVGTLDIEVVADLTCPFCFIGKQRLDEALKSVGGPVSVSWHPFQLNPGMPAAGEAFDDYLEARFGSRAAVEPVLGQLAREGRECGIDFRFDRIERVANTLRAHTLLNLAAQAGVAEGDIVDTLFRAFFEAGADIGDPELLAGIGARHGLARDAVIAALGDTDAGRAAGAAVEAREARVRASGIAAVPAFLFNRRLLMTGAQSTSTMIAAIDRAMFGAGDDEAPPPLLN